MKNISSARCCV